MDKRVNLSFSMTVGMDMPEELNPQMAGCILEAILAKPSINAEVRAFFVEIWAREAGTMLKIAEDLYAQKYSQL